MAHDVIIIEKQNLYYLRGEKKQSLYNIISLSSLKCDMPVYKREGGEVALSEECLSTAIGRFQEKAGIRLKELHIILPHAVTWFNYLTVESLPKSEDEVQEFILWKTQKLLPIPKEESLIRYQLLSKEKGASKVLVAATFSQFVKNMENSFKKLGLRIIMVSPPTVSFLNLFSQTLPKNGLVCWLREEAYSMICFSDGFPIVIREVDRPINRSRIEPEIYSFSQSVKETYPQYNQEEVYYFDEQQKGELKAALSEFAKELDYKKLLQKSDEGMPELPKYVSALGVLE